MDVSEDVFQTTTIAEANATSPGLIPEMRDVAENVIEVNLGEQIERFVRK